MEMKDFFDFASQPASSTVQAHPSELSIDPMKLIKGNYQDVDLPIIFKQVYGNKLYDILDTGCAGFFLISERMKKILEENSLTGWKTFPIKLYDKKGSEITGYHGFSVVGHSGPTNYKNSEIVERRKVSTGPLCKYYKGVSVDNWDGSDFFTPEKTYQTFITKKAADILKKNKITNMYIENLADHQIAVRYIEKDS